MVLRKASKGLITQAQAARELQLSERHVRRLIARLRSEGDKAVQHGLKGRPSNRKIEASVQSRALKVLRQPVYAGFGPTLAGEYLAERHDIEVSRETLRRWMTTAGLWKPKRQTRPELHTWRPRRACRGELVQWDTSTHAWLENRGPGLYLVSMIDDATSQLFARFVERDTTEENLRVLWQYLERYGRPMSFYTDKAGLFRVGVKTKRQQDREGRDAPEMPPTQIGRALEELGIELICAHSPQAKGRVERVFGTAQDRLVKGLRVAGVRTLQAANEYLDKHYLSWWNRTCAVAPANDTDAHRPLSAGHNLPAILSHVETRRVTSDYTFQFRRRRYQIPRDCVCAGLRGGSVRIEVRLDETMAVSFRDRYLPVQECCSPDSAPAAAAAPAATDGATSTPKPKQKSKWMKGFWERSAPPLWAVMKS